MTAEEKLGYVTTKDTRFRLRFEAYDSPSDRDPSSVLFIEDLLTLEAAQIAYIEARDASGLGASRVLPGDVLDQNGDHIARISYNGRLWAPEPLSSGGEPISEAPRLPDPEDFLVWMVGTRESVLQDGFTAGPDNAPDILKLGMEEGDILVGKDRQGNIRVVMEMGPDGCVVLPGGIDDLRQNDSPEP